MADDSTPRDINKDINKEIKTDIKLETLLKAAGNSFVDAQKALLPGFASSVSMMLSNAELELKVTAGTDEAGNMLVRPLSFAEINNGEINPALVSVLRFSFVGSVDNLKPRQQQGPGVVSTTPDKVPSLLGLSPKEAEALLSNERWRFERHSTAVPNKPAAEVAFREKVIRQQPLPGQSANRQDTVVHFWTGLSDFAVKEIDGIGEKLGKTLSKIGVDTASDLIAADVGRLSETLNVSENRVRDFVDMAILMSSLAVLDSKDKVELLVKGANIRSVDELASADPDKLYLVCKSAVDSGKVRVPNTFTLTQEDVRKWKALAASAGSEDQ